VLGLTIHKEASKRPANDALYDLTRIALHNVTSIRSLSLRKTKMLFSRQTKMHKQQETCTLQLNMQFGISLTLLLI
jgi:hypothetical protein